MKKISICEITTIHEDVIQKVKENMPEENIMKGGMVGTEPFMAWLEKIPRSDVFYKEGDIEIDGSAFWDSPEEG